MNVWRNGTQGNTPTGLSEAFAVLPRITRGWMRSLITSG